MLDPTTFDYEPSIWGDIFIHLQNEGFEVYSPAVKVGECDRPYIVIKNDGSTNTSFSSDIDLYAVMIFVPKQSYSKLEVMKMAVKRSMKKIEPLLLPYGLETPSYYDDEVKAHTVSITYKNYKKN